MTDFSSLQVLGRVIRDALDPDGNDYQREARAVVAAIRADTEQGAALRLTVLGQDANKPALWDRLDDTAPTSAQMIEWNAPHTAALLRQMRTSRVSTVAAIEQSPQRFSRFRPRSRTAVDPDGGASQHLRAETLAL